MRRASRGRLFRPLSWRDVRGTEGCAAIGAACEACEDCGCVWVWGAVGGEAAGAPFVRGASPLGSAIVMCFSVDTKYRGRIVGFRRRACLGAWWIIVEGCAP